MFTLLSNGFVTWTPLHLMLGKWLSLRTNDNFTHCCGVPSAASMLRNMSPACSYNSVFAAYSLGVMVFLFVNCFFL